jgi:hypothetical protein
MNTKRRTPIMVVIVGGLGCTSSVFNDELDEIA